MYVEQEKGACGWPEHAKALAAQDGLPCRSSKSCRLRWCNHLNPDIKRTAFSAKEDAVILEAHKATPQPLYPTARLHSLVAFLPSTSSRTSYQQPSLQACHNLTPKPTCSPVATCLIQDTACHKCLNPPLDS